MEVKANQVSKKKQISAKYRIFISRVGYNVKHAKDFTVNNVGLTFLLYTDLFPTLETIILKLISKLYLFTITMYTVIGQANPAELLVVQTANDFIILYWIKPIT